MFGHDNQDNQDNQQNDNNQPPIAEPAMTDSQADEASTAPVDPGDGSGQVFSAPTDDNTSDAPANNDNESDDTSAGSEDEKPVVDENLVSIKQQALQQLAPLVGHLDQTPEEKFKTTMMMIQASDDQTLVQTAYDAAQQIADEKAKAQALLDVVNEINYFTQQSKD